MDTVVDHFAQLDETLKRAVKRAEQKVLWDQTHACVRCGDKDVNAYPVRRSGGRVVWNVISRENGHPIAWGVL